MKKHNLNLITFIVVASLSILPAYASKVTTDLLQNNTVIVEQNASKIAKVTNIKIVQKEIGATISGKVDILFNRSIHSKLYRPGHVDISIVDSKGNMKKLASVEYKKISKSRSAKFSYDLSNVPKSGSKLIITHYTKTHYPE